MQLSHFSSNAPCNRALANPVGLDCGMPQSDAPSRTVGTILPELNSFEI